MVPVAEKEAGAERRVVRELMRYGAAAFAEVKSRHSRR